MKNGELLELYEALVRISQNKELKLKVTLGYALMKNKTLLEPEAKIIYDLRKNILLEYGTKDKNGDIIIPNENMSVVQEKLDELMNMDNITKFLMLPLDAFVECELNIGDIEGIQYMIKIPE